MDYRTLGTTNLQVSAICLGTMTWGQQNTEAEAHEQLDYALTQGINLIDTAEMYPVPAQAETQGRTEAYIGTWLASRKNRDKVILATKVAGRSSMQWIRGGTRLTRQHVLAAVETSLQRLQTDYIDLYQVHWPDRRTNYFGQLGYTHPEFDDGIAIEETLTALDDLVKAGKIRYVGISNETPWGMMQYLNLAKEKNLPRAMSIQNPYSLLNRSFEVGLAEMAIREQCGLLAYSPLAFGRLSGKYLDNPDINNTRLTIFDNFTRYEGQESLEATKRYVALAKESGLTPTQMALAFVNSRLFVTANIIGATTMDQLKENIGSIDVQLSPDVIEAIDAIHQAIPNPAP